jgi:hypothetical protein
LEQLTAYICILLTVAAVAALPQLIGPSRRRRNRPVEEPTPPVTSTQPAQATSLRAELAEVD